MRAEKIKEGKILVVKYFKRERWRYKLANVVKVSDFYVDMSDGSNLEIKTDIATS